MAIYAPGYRDRHNKPRFGGRSAVAALSLTAMVDLFTVLVVFLLQNYSVTGEVIFIPKGVTLPSASAVKELKPSNIVIISEQGVTLNKDLVITLADVKGSSEWLIKPLYDKLATALEAEKTKRESSVKNRINTVVQSINNPKAPPEDPNQYRKVTVQADKQMDFMTIKKIMFTVTEAGAGEINFAVIKKGDTTKVAAAH